MKLLLILTGLPFLFWTSQSLAFLGTELGPLLQLVSGQLTEIEKLTENIEAAQEQTKALRELNDGIDRTVSQIYNIQSIIERSQNLDPRSVQSLADLNDLQFRARRSKEQIEDLMAYRVILADQAITGSALQSDTAYKMGQEMVVTGARLSEESKNASPGRASQISAASNSAQMLATGVQLQTMSQMVQLQAMSLELQKSQIQQEVQASKIHKAAYQKQLEVGMGSVGSKRQGFK